MVFHNQTQISEVTICYISLICINLLFNMLKMINKQIAHSR